jgi:hypothetical protein
LQATGEPQESTQNSNHDSKVQAQKKLVEDLKVQWKLLWSQRFEDKVRAEGVSTSEYTALSVEQGTIIHATKDFKALNFKEILQKNLVENPDRYIQPDVNTGGWKKFIKTDINTRKSLRNDYSSTLNEKKSDKSLKQHPKKGGRGWLHIT